MKTKNTKAKNQLAYYTDQELIEALEQKGYNTRLLFGTFEVEMALGGTGGEHNYFSNKLTKEEKTQLVRSMPTEGIHNDLVSLIFQSTQLAVHMTHGLRKKTKKTNRQTNRAANNRTNHKQSNSGPKKD